MTFYNELILKGKIPIVFSHQKLEDNLFTEERSIWEEISQVNKSNDEKTEYVN